MGFFVPFDLVFSVHFGKRSLCRDEGSDRRKAAIDLNSSIEFEVKASLRSNGRFAEASCLSVFTDGFR